VLARFVLEGLAGSQPVLVAAPPRNLAALRGVLGGAAAAVTMADMTDVGRNPAGILGGVLGAFADRHPQRRVRIIGEPVWVGRTAAEYPACVQHEALINAAFAGREVSVVCPYDAGRLPVGVLADARSTHPELWSDGARTISSDFAPAAALQRYNRPLPTSLTGATYTVRGVPDLRRARSFAARYARWSGLDADRVGDLQLITTELATNSLEHAGSPCRLSFWQQDDHLICEARDGGRFGDPLAGRRPLRAHGARGRGLFLVNALADLVRTHTGPGGTTIHAYLRLGPVHRNRA
jgi:anti-sigma regulatory factor (Ser/Thr protein kinase)